MRKLWLVLFLLGLGLAPAWAQNPPSVLAPYTQISTPTVATSATNLTVVTSQTVNGYGTRIYVTSWFAVPTSGTSVQFTAVPTTCGTSAVSLTSSMTFAGNVPVQPGNGSAPILITPAGYALCMQTSNGAAPGYVSYSQF